MARTARVRRLEVSEKEFQEMEKKICRAGAYRRLSDEDNQLEENNSIGNQLKIIENFVSMSSDIEIVKIYADNGYSGMNYKRPGYIQMMEDLYAGIIDTVIVKDISRLGRHYILTSELVEKTFPSMDVRLICVNDHYDSNDSNADISSLLLPIKMIMNDNYAKDFSKKIRSSIETKMSGGEFLPASGSIPYGYLRNEEKLTFDIDTEVAPVIREIYQLRSEGESYNAIARMLNEEGKISPGNLRYIRGLTKNPKYEKSNWLRGAVRKICEDPVYIGSRVHGKVKRDRLGTNKTRRDADEWQIIENAHEPIIDKELFNKVQAVNEKSLKKLDARNKREDVLDDKRDLLKDKIECADCGSKMSARKGLSRINKKKESRPAFVYYTCNQYVYTNHAVCNSHYIRQETLLKAIKTCLNNQLKVAVDFEDLLKDVRAKPVVKAYQRNMMSELASLRARKTNIEAKKVQLLDDLLSDILSDFEYRRMSKKLEKEITEITRKITEVRSEYDQLDSIEKSSMMWMKELKGKIEVGELDEHLINLLIQKILVFDGQRVQILLNYKDPMKPVIDYLKHVEEVMEDAV